MSEGPVQARNGKGRFVRTLANVDRDRLAAEAHAMGATYQEVADRFGYHDRQTAYRAVAKVLAANVLMAGSVQERRARQLEELRLASARAWDLILNPLPAISRTGKVVTREDGSEVPDAGSIAAMIALVGRLSELESRLTGTQVPKRSVHLSGEATVETVGAFLDSLPDGMLLAVVAERQRQAGERERAAVLGVVEELARRGYGCGPRRVWP